MPNSTHVYEIRECRRDFRRGEDAVTVSIDRALHEQM